MGEDLVWFALDQLRKEDLVTGNEEAPVQFDGLSRREVIRKIGFGSLVVLPIVSAIVVPNAAMAQSCVIPGNSCPILPADPAITTLGPCITYCNGGSTSCCSGNAVLNVTLSFPPAGVCTCLDCTCI